MRKLIYFLDNEINIIYINKKGINRFMQNRKKWFIKGSPFKEKSIYTG